MTKDETKREKASSDERGDERRVRGGNIEKRGIPLQYQHSGWPYMLYQHYTADSSHHLCYQ